VPIYDYVCESCGHVVEVIHGISAAGPAACERCGGPMKRALSAPAIVFKGSGWAKKDARDASRSRASSTAKGTDATATEGTGPAASSTGTSGEKPASSGASDGGGSPSDGGGSSTTTTTTPTTGGSGAAAG
jgi:putative FmdB family regulatory protein